MALLHAILGDKLPVFISELAPPFRSIILAGKDRPEPVERESKQRAKQTWYPGQTQASTQVLGAQEEPLVLTGRFRDPLSLLDGGAQGRMEILRGMLLGQRGCRLLWGDAISLQGRVAGLKFKTYRLNDVGYEITFEIDKSDDIAAMVGLVGAATTASQVGDAIEDVSAVFDDLALVAGAQSPASAFLPLP
jgi:hypothetical protein